MQNCLLREAASLDASSFRDAADRPSRRCEARNDDPCQNPEGRRVERDARAAATGGEVSGRSGLITDEMLGAGDAVAMVR